MSLARCVCVCVCGLEMWHYDEDWCTNTQTNTLTNTPYCHKYTYTIHSPYQLVWTETRHTIKRFYFTNWFHNEQAKCPFCELQATFRHQHPWRHHASLAICQSKSTGNTSFCVGIPSAGFSGSASQDSGMFLRRNFNAFITKLSSLSAVKSPTLVGDSYWVYLFTARPPDRTSLGALPGLIPAIAQGSFLKSCGSEGAHLRKTSISDGAHFLTGSASFVVMVTWLREIATDRWQTSDIIAQMTWHWRSTDVITKECLVLKLDEKYFRYWQH